MSSPERTKVAFRTLGCKVNQVESEDIAAALLGRGAEIVPESEARVVIVNTCTVTAEADAKARQAVRRALRLPSAPIVVVTGCLAAVDREAIEGLGGTVVVEADKRILAERVADLLGLEAAEPARFAPARAGEGFRTRAMLKIEDGCDAFCAYCIVPYARGGPRSTALEGVVAEAERLRAAGAREIVLTGINIGRYGDQSGHDLADVVRAVAAVGVERVRISSIEPLDLDERLLDALASTPAVCEHLHVPLQSASDRVLKAMRRGYTASEFAARIEAARAALPGLEVTTDVLVGFPGERTEDADLTAAFVRDLGLARLHVFRYSARPGTVAAEMDAHVDPGERSARAARLRDLDTSLRAAHLRRRLGQTSEVLVERVGADGEGEGTTRDYLRVSLAQSPPAGALVSARIGVAPGGGGVATVEDSIPSA